MVWRGVIIVLLVCVPGAFGQRVLSRAEYQDRLHGLWLGQCIANWTGLRTEGQRIAPPFFTDADWGTLPPGWVFPIEFVLNQDPWYADDDTDIEYVYVHKLSTLNPPRGLLTADEIRDAWLAHMDRDWIWVSNRQAYDLMGRGVRPPMTGQPICNDLWAFIDAQLTTEIFGALSPGLPAQALANADLPIRTTAFGHAIQASQYFVVLYSLATQVPAGLNGRERGLWLVREARRWIWSGSKAADIVDFVLADYLANPDVNNWELTRDRIAQRYMINATANGWQYWNWAESSVNFACGVMCLLYGEGDYKRTVQIGTLSGWDSDNGTATMGGLLGLMLGYEGVKAQFPGHSFSDRYDIERTRNNLPDYLPADPLAQDRLGWVAARMMPVIDANVAAAGGVVAGGQWVLPGNAKPLVNNPGYELWRRSANCRVASAGGTVVGSTSAPPGPNMPSGVSNPWYIGNGYEHDFSGLDWQDWKRRAYTTEGTGASGSVTLSVEYDRPVEVAVVRFIEGDHVAGVGGWFAAATVQVKVGGTWVSPAVLAPGPGLDPAQPFQVVDYTLKTPVNATGVRIVGQLPVGGYVTCCELDALSRQAKVAEWQSSR